MVNKPITPPRLYRAVRDQLGSVRRVYLRGNRIVRRGDFARHEQTVLLLHGFFQTRNVWEVMEDRLRHDGYGVFSFDLGGFMWSLNTRNIKDLAQHVADKLEGVCARYGLERFHIIGHSQGGLVGRHYVQQLGGEERVKGLITLGTPHHGTPTAALGAVLMGGGMLSRSPFQMLPGSSFLKGLNEEVFPSNIPLTSIYSKHDLVCPWWCSALHPQPGATHLRNHVVRGVGHTALTYDPGVYGLIRRQLDAQSEQWRDQGVPTAAR